MKVRVSADVYLEVEITKEEQKKLRSSTRKALIKEGFINVEEGVLRDEMAGSIAELVKEKIVKLERKIDEVEIEQFKHVHLHEIEHDNGEIEEVMDF